MFWKRKAKKNNPESKVVSGDRKAPDPDLLKRLSRLNPPPSPPVVYVPPLPPDDSLAEESSAASLPEEKQPPQPSEAPLTSLPADPETLTKIEIRFSDDGKVHLSPVQGKRVQKPHPPQKVKPQIIVKR